jgi:hypothetical protein
MSCGVHLEGRGGGGLCLYGMIRQRDPERVRGSLRGCPQTLVDSTLFGRTPRYGVSFQTSSLSAKANCVPSCELEFSLPSLPPSLPPLPLSLSLPLPPSLPLSLKPKIKTIKTDDFFNFKYNENVENDRNETNYIAHYKTWLNLFFPDQVGTKNLNWFVFNQNKVL